MQVSWYITSWLARWPFTEDCLMRPSRHVYSHCFHYLASRCTLFLFRLFVMLLFWPRIKRKILISLNAIRRNAASPHPDLGQRYVQLVFAEMVSLWLAVSVYNWRRAGRIGKKFDVLCFCTSSSNLNLHWSWITALEDLHAFVRMSKTGNVCAERNIETLPRNHCCRGGNKGHIFWVCVCSLSYATYKAHAPYCHLWPGWL